MSKGWVKIHRSIWESEIWKSKSPFDERSAWLDMILMANIEEKNAVIGKGVEKVERGSFVTSELKLMERWGWGKSRTRTFLKILEKLGQIELQTNRNRTAITIVNYSIYQDSRTTDDTTADTTAEPQPNHSPATTKEYKELKNIKKEVTSTSAEIIRAWNSLPAPVPRITKILAGSSREKKLRKRIAEYGLAEVQRAIDNIRDSDFLQGGGSKGWIVTFDWFISPENFQKTLDGNYADKKSAASGTEEWRRAHTGLTQEDIELYG